MPGNICKQLKSKKGQSLVETALILPIVLLLFCGIVDFGWIMSNQLIVENSSREGARLGMVVADQTDYANQISDRAISVTPNFAHSGISVSSTLSCPSDPSLGDVTVTVRYSFRLLTPLAQMILGSQNYTAISTCIMNVE